MIQGIKNKFLNDTPMQSVTAAAFIVAMSGVASRVLGLVRDRILASTFGAGDTLDVYYAAFRVPDSIYNLLIIGALSAAFIPVFTGLISHEKKEEAWKMVSGMITLQVIALGIISVILAILAPWVMKVVTPGFSPEKINAAASFTRIMFLSPLILGMSAVFGGILVSFKRFMAYSMAPIFYNIGIIIGAVFFVRFMGPIGLAWGVILGAVMHLLIQYPAVKSSGFKFKPILQGVIKNPYIKKVLLLMVPRTLSVAATQINFLIITIFASTLQSGSLAIFNFANNIQSAPLSLCGISFAVAVFPVLSSYAAKNDFEGFGRTFSKTLRQILFLIIPLSALLFILRAQIVRVFLGSGQFDWEDTILTFNVLGILAISLFAQSLIQLLARAFYALHNTKTPFYVALISEAVNFLAVVLLIRRFEISGLAIAFSLSAIVNMSLLFLLLKKKVDHFSSKIISIAVLKILAATAAAALAIQISKNIVARLINLDTFVGIASQLLVSVLIGLSVFIVFCMILKIKEFYYFKNSITKRIFKQKTQISEIPDEIEGV
jgi:putative peptidoglycan lipid II flippase